MVENPVVRAIQADDLPAVLSMVGALAEHHGDKAMLSAQDLARDCLGAQPWVRVLVAEVGGSLKGYAALVPLVQLQFGVRGMDMHHLFVAQGFRGMGIGRALIRGCIEAAQAAGCRYMTVGTHPDNEPAAAIYLAAGFEPLPPPGPRFRIKFDA